MGAIRYTYACLDCRRSWKGGRFEGVDFGNADKSIGTVHCPECKAPGRDMGRNFKPPPRNNKSQWKKVILLATARQGMQNIRTFSEAKGLLKKARQRKCKSCNVVHYPLDLFDRWNWRFCSARP